MRLVADIGGTNARLALAEQSVIVPSSVRRFANVAWPQFSDLLTSYLCDVSPRSLDDIVVAVAGPVHGDRAVLTNRNWNICADDLARKADCGHARLINDLTALGYAVPTLGPNQLVRIVDGGSAQRPNNLQSLVVGIGTGFNVSPVVMSNKITQCLSAEAGHVSLPESVARLIEDFIDPQPNFVTVEALFSGRGFSEFCARSSGCCELTGISAISLYGKAEGRDATEAIDRYSALLGQLLRELSLAYMPSSGIYLAGSVAKAILEKSPRPCTEVYAQNCKIGGAAPPNLYLIADDVAALSGCAALMSS